MCGIAGILELQGAAPPRHLLQVMGDRLRHRGPDGEGLYINGPCGLVHRRLAILDPDRGAQPLSNADGTVWITYNGEIYNSPELRRYLQGKGYGFRTTTDTEVIVCLYEEDPEHFVERLEGMFAFGLWDARRQHLIVARDYLGIKPLYYYQGPDCFVFASEVKALLVDPRVPCQPDAKGLVEILAFQNMYPGRTCFQDITLLQGGEIRCVKTHGTTSSRKFWTFETPVAYRHDSMAEAALELRELLETVITDHLLSDVPVASYLSGGMDSGTLVAVASRHLPALMTFSGGFLLDDSMPAFFRTYDERDAALLMSRTFGTQHHFREIRPEDHIEHFAAISWHLEEPRVSTCYAPWVMSREAGAHVKVILTGHGGDELFAGYHYKYYPAKNLTEDWDDAWFAHLNWLMPQAQASQWLHPDFATSELLAWPRQAFNAFVRGSRGLTPMGRSQHHDLFVYMHGLLCIEDKLSMAHSLESRVPFLDRRVFNFAWSLPDDWKINQDYGKVILREALQGLIPDEILARRKMGFGPPDNHYYRTSLRPFLESILLDGGFARRGLVKAEKVQDILRLQMEGVDLQQALWTFASLEMWYQTFMDRQLALRATASDAQPAPLVLHVPTATTAVPAASPPSTTVASPAPAPVSRPPWLRLGRSLAGKVYRQTRAVAGKVYRTTRAVAGKAYRYARPAGGKVYGVSRRVAGTTYRSARPVAARAYRYTRAVASQVYHHPGTVLHKAYHRVRALASRGYGAPRARLATMLRSLLTTEPLVPPYMPSYVAAWWKLTSGRYGVEMRAKLERHLATIPRPQPALPLRIFHGLYHAPQPVFINQAFKKRGLTSTYETLDRNPGFPPVDVHHQMHHPDIYREHAVLDGETLIRNNPAVTNEANLDQLEQFFLDRWPNYDVYHFNWFLSFLPDNIDVEFMRHSGRAVYFHFRGCFILTKIIQEFTERGATVADACQHCKRMGWRDAYFARFYRGVSQASRVFTSTPNLCHCSPDFEYFPNSLEPVMESIPPVTPTARRDGPVVVMHSAFNEEVHSYKGTPHIIRAVRTLQQEGLAVELKIVEKMSRAEAVQQYGQCDIFVEQLHLGCYSNVAIEALAYGVPVISSLPPAHAHLAPGCPIIHADPVTITDRLRELVLDPELRAEIGRRSYTWVREFHSNERLAAHLLRIYQEDLGFREPQPRNNLANRHPKYGD